MVCTFPPMVYIYIKKKTKIDSSTQHDLLSIKEYVFVTGSKALTE